MMGAAGSSTRKVSPSPSEQVEQYHARRVRDRFTLDMLNDSLRHLGLAPFEEDFYLPNRKARHRPPLPERRRNSGPFAEHLYVGREQGRGKSGVSIARAPPPSQGGQE